MICLSTTGMLTALEALPAQCAEACWNLVKNVEPPEIEAISNIVVTGLVVRLLATFLSGSCKTAEAQL
ncbi:MAG: hypothetical protein A4E55_02468 [Pelotomaculum sp. PtaU1.Bin035]|nr:MAG: hypothetical protein A4E55_02468 [Pelotomaculum sp. PtaU1.Bin035]